MGVLLRFESFPSFTADFMLLRPRVKNIHASVANPGFPKYNFMGYYTKGVKSTPILDPVCKRTRSGRGTKCF